MSEPILHCSGPGCQVLPAVNVKVRMFSLPDSDDVLGSFVCSEEEAKSFINQMFDLQQQWFWILTAPRLTKERWGEGARAVSGGRNNGWLEVEGIGLPEEWSTSKLAEWSLFEDEVREAVKIHCETERWLLGLKECGCFPLLEDGWLAMRPINLLGESGLRASVEKTGAVYKSSEHLGLDYKTLGSVSCRHVFQHDEPEQAMVGFRASLPAGYFGEEIENKGVNGWWFWNHAAQDDSTPMHCIEFVK